MRICPHCLAECQTGQDDWSTLSKYPAVLVKWRPISSPQVIKLCALLLTPRQLQEEVQFCIIATLFYAKRKGAPDTSSQLKPRARPGHERRSHLRCRSPHRQEKIPTLLTLRMRPRWRGCCFRTVLSHRTWEACCPR